MKTTLKNKELYNTIEEVLRNRILYIGNEIPEGLMNDKGNKQIYLGFPVDLIDRLYLAIMLLEGDKRKKYNRLRTEIRYNEGRCKDCGTKLIDSKWRCKTCRNKANEYAKNSRRKSLTNNT